MAFTWVDNPRPDSHPTAQACAVGAPRWSFDPRAGVVGTGPALRLVNPSERHVCRGS